MKAVVLTDREGPTIEVTEVAEPVCGEFDILLRPEAASINHLDYEVVLGRGVGAAASVPHILGSDPVGTVVEVGNAVTSLVPGDRAAVRPWINCGSCAFCIAGEDNQCDAGRIHGVHTPGGMAELAAVPEQAVFGIPESLGAQAMAAQANSTPVAVQVLTTAGTTSDDTVLVLGAAGALGSALVQVGKSLGATVIAGARDEAQLDYLDELGADHSFTYGSDPDFAESLKSVVGGNGVSVYCELAGSAELWKQATALIGRHGRVVVVGKHAAPKVDLDLLWIYGRRITIIGSGGSSRASFEKAVQLADAGIVRPPRFVTLGPSDYREGLEIFEARDRKEKAVFDLTLL